MAADLSTTATDYSAKCRSRDSTAKPNVTVRVRGLPDDLIIAAIVPRAEATLPPIVAVLPSNHVLLPETDLHPHGHQQGLVSFVAEQRSVAGVGRALASSVARVEWQGVVVARQLLQLKLM